MNYQGSHDGHNWVDIDKSQMLNYRYVRPITDADTLVKSVRRQQVFNDWSYQKYNLNRKTLIL